VLHAMPRSTQLLKKVVSFLKSILLEVLKLY
jgi:hypothetical protein